MTIIIEFSHNKVQFWRRDFIVKLNETKYNFTFNHFLTSILFSLYSELCCIYKVQLNATAFNKVLLAKHRSARIKIAAQG